MTEWNWNTLNPIMPEMIVIITGLLMLLYGAFRGNSGFGLVTTLCVGVVAVAIAHLIHAPSDTQQIFGGMLVVDTFSQSFKVLILGGLAISMLLAFDWLKENAQVRFEFPLLMLLSGVGMMFMVSANDLLSLYVSLELSSLCLYVLAAIRRENAASSEAGIKYFILGALSSGLLLFGISLVYGYAGSVSYTAIQATLSSLEGQAPVGVVLGMVFILAGMAFKVSAVPFHMWTPDVYQGAPTPVTAFFAIVPKVAALAMMSRLLCQPFLPLLQDWSQIVTFMAVASMVWGAFAAIAQENIKRLIAYSSIANMGYALLGILAAQQGGIAAVMLYAGIYMVMTAGTFAIILCLRRSGESVENISDLAGLSKTSPFVAYCMAAMMFSMSGIPPLAGFFGKLFIFQTAVAAQYYTVAVIGVLASVVGAYYYLRIIKVMFFDEPVGGFDKDGSVLRRNIALVSVALILIFCVMPSGVLEQAQVAAVSLFE